MEVQMHETEVVKISGLRKLGTSMVIDEIYLYPRDIPMQQQSTDLSEMGKKFPVVVVVDILGTSVVRPHIFNYGGLPDYVIDLYSLYNDYLILIPCEPLLDIVSHIGNTISLRKNGPDIVNWSEVVVPSIYIQGNDILHGTAIVDSYRPKRIDITYVLQNIFDGILSSLV